MNHELSFIGQVEQGTGNILDLMGPTLVNHLLLAQNHPWPMYAVTPHWGLKGFLKAVLAGRRRE